MPVLFPDARFFQVATVISSIGDTVTIRIQGIRAYEVNVTWSAFPRMVEAFDLAHGFTGGQEAGEDFMNLMQAIGALPAVIEKGTQLPYSYFVNSPYADPDLYTFQYNYYFQGLTCKPYMHIDTAIELFPPNLSAFLVIDATAEYKRLKLRERPLCPDGWVEKALGKNAVYIPPESSWGGSGGIELFTQYETMSPFRRSILCMAIPFFKEVDFENFGVEGLLFKGAIKTDEYGRSVLYGEEGSTEFPYRALLPVPTQSRRLSVTYGAYNHVSGVLNLMSSTAGNIEVYPPEKPEDPGEPALPPPQELAMYFVTRQYCKRKAECSGLLDGTWALDRGDVKL